MLKIRKYKIVNIIDVVASKKVSLNVKSKDAFDGVESRAAVDDDDDDDLDFM